MRGRIFIGKPGIRTHQMAAIIFNLVRRIIFYHHHPLTVLHGSSHGIFQAFQIDLIHNNLIHHDFNIMHLVTINTHPDLHFPQLTVYPYRDKTILSQIFE